MKNLVATKRLDNKSNTFELLYIIPYTKDIFNKMKELDQKIMNYYIIFSAVSFIFKRITQVR